MRTLIYIMAFIMPSALLAQELNLGLHANPTIGIPVLDSRSQSTEGLSPTVGSLHFNGGANIQVRKNNVAIETGVNFLSKNIGFKQNIVNTGYGLAAAYNVRVASSSIEIPLQVNYRVYHHEHKTFYDIYLVGGASYEWNKIGSYKSKGTSSSYGRATLSATANVSADPALVNNQMAGISSLLGAKQEWANLIVGFKVSTVIKKLGLIDYGLVYHLPLADAGLYHVEAEQQVNNTTTTSYVGDFYPRLSYIDIKLAYYFLNFEKGTGRKRYRNYSPPAIENNG